MGVYIHTADGLPLRTTWARAASAALYAYDAFGFGSAGGSVSFPHRFSTKPYDEDLMLSDFGRRWYWPEIYWERGMKYFFGDGSDVTIPIDQLGLTSNVRDYFDPCSHRRGNWKGLKELFRTGNWSKAGPGRFF